jgi:hypothetical protein
VQCFYAFKAEEGRANGDKASGGVQQKWVSNYVPYGYGKTYFPHVNFITSMRQARQTNYISNGPYFFAFCSEFPAGKNAPAVASTEDESKEAGASASTSNGVEAKWKKNYVPYKGFYFIVDNTVGSQANAKSALALRGHI